MATKIKEIKDKVKAKVVDLKNKALKQAKKIAKGTKQGKHVAKKHKVYTKVRFYRPNTLQLRRNPKYALSSRGLHSIKVGVDKYDILKHPLNTEKAMKKIEDENTIAFIVDNRATKPQIKQAFFQIYNVKARSVNTLVRADGKKKAYVRLGAESDALNLANKIGII